MFYSIILPLIIVLSLSVAIALFVRRVRRITLEDAEKLKSYARVSAKRMLNGKLGKPHLKKAALAVVEKTLHVLRWATARGNEQIMQWVAHVKRKKREGQEDSIVDETLSSPRGIPAKRERPVVLKTSSSRIGKTSQNSEKERKIDNFFATDTNFQKKSPGAIKGEKKTVQKESEPLIRKEIAVPDKKSGKSLEAILIERITLDPRDVEAYERLGDYYLERENYQDAKECFKYVVKIAPSNRNTKAKLRRLERLMTKR